MLSDLIFENTRNRRKNGAIPLQMKNILRVIALVLLGCFGGLSVGLADGVSDSGTANRSEAGQQDGTVVRGNAGVAGRLITMGEPHDLCSIRLEMKDAPNPTGGFSLALHQDNGSGEPGERVAQFSGSDNPAKAGFHTYELEEVVILEPETSYWLVASVSSEDGVYCYQTGREPETSPRCGNWSEFVRLDGQNATSVPVPAMSVQFQHGGLSDPMVQDPRYRLLWTLVLVATIGFCSLDVFSFPRVSLR